MTPSLDAVGTLNQIFTNVDDNSISMVNVVLKFIYPNLNLLDFVDADNEPATPTESDAYLVPSGLTDFWELTGKEENQVIYWDGAAWATLPEKTTELYTKFISIVNEQAGRALGDITTTDSPTGSEVVNDYYLALIAGTYTNFLDGSSNPIVTTGERQKIKKTLSGAWQLEDDYAARIAEIIKIMSLSLKSINLNWNFKNVAYTTTTYPSSPTLNDVHIPMENGTIFGVSVTDYTKQVLVYDGSAFVVAPIKSLSLIIDELITSSPNITTGYYLNSTGVPVVFSGSYYTEYIPVSSKRSYLIKSNSTDSRSIVIYDSEYNVLEAYTGFELGSSVLTANSYYKSVLYMPTGAAFIRISGSSISNLPSVWAMTTNSYQMNKLMLNINMDIQANTSSIQANTDQIELITDMIGYEMSNNELSPVEILAGYINNAGTVSTGFSGDYHTDYISVDGLTSYKYIGKFTDARCYAEYDENKVLIKSLSAFAIGTPVLNYSFRTEENTRYVRFSVYQNNQVYSLSEIAKNLKYIIDEILENVVINDTDFDYLSPETVFGIDNDANSGNFFNREYALRLYPESFLKNKLPIKLNNNRSAVVQSLEKNTASKEIDVINYQLSGEGYLTRSGTFNYIRTKSSNAKNKSMRLLCIGNSITALDLKQTNGQSIGGWAYPSITKELSIKDNVDHGDDAINLLMVGRLNYNSGRSFDYSGTNYPLRSFSEGQGSRTAASFARHATHIYSSNGAVYWQMLGLTTQEGHEYTGSDTDKNLLMTTVQQDNWDYGAELYSYFGYVDEYIGTQTQMDAIDSDMTNLLNNPDIPFYDLTTAKSGVGYSFNLQTYLDRYKTLSDADGETRLIVSSTAGVKVTDASAYDVCTPTHIVIELGENDRWHYVPTALDIVNSLELISTAIHSTHPNVLIGFVNTRMTGSYYPENWEDKGYFKPMVQSFNEIKYDIQYILKLDVGTLATQNANKIYLLPTYHTMSINSFSSTRQVIDLMDMNILLSGNIDVNHPGIAASTDIAYQILSWIYYTL